MLLFADVNLWVAAIILRSIPRDGRLAAALCADPLFAAWPAQLAGVLLTTVAFGLCVEDLGTAWRLGIDGSYWSKPMTTRVYALSRNLICRFLDLYSVGTCLIIGTPFFL